MTTTKRPTRRRPGDGPAPRKLPILPIVGGVVAVALIATILLTFGSGSAATETGDPSIGGDPLPLFAGAATDEAIGLPIPEVEGADFAGTPISIRDDGRAKVILFLAHWCPVCQSEVPIVRDLVSADGVPADVDLYSVATGISSTRDNYPPSEWLEREAWNVPVIVDDGGSSVGDAFGLSAYPFWVFVDSDGTVIGRLTGRIDGEALQALLAGLVQESAG